MENEKIVVDESDRDILEMSWYVDNLGYVARKDGRRLARKTVYMHRVILERKIDRRITSFEECDHIDGNKLNNSRSNLRISTRSQNQANRKKLSNNKSGYKGVSFHKSSKKWIACVVKDGVSYYCGSFDDPISAARSRDKKALELFGEFAFLNFKE